LPHSAQKFALHAGPPNACSPADQESPWPNKHSLACYDLKYLDPHREALAKGKVTLSKAVQAALA
jgi:hypothetical protein